MKLNSISYCVTFNAIPRYGYYRIRKIFRNQRSHKKELPSLLIIIGSTKPTVGKNSFVSLMIRIINDTSLASKKVGVTLLLRNIIVSL